MDDFEPRRPRQVIRDAEHLRAILDQAPVGYLGLSREGEPYVVPCNFVRVGETLVIHSAPVGKKVAFLRANPAVCFCVVGRAAKVPDRMTFAFESVLVYGRARFLDDRPAKRRAYLALIEKYEPLLAESLGEACIDKSAVIELAIEKMTGKRGAVDSTGDS